MTNKIRRYFESGPGRYNGSAYDTFKRKIADGESLRNLCRFLEGAGLKVSPTTVQKYIDTLEVEYRQQRKVEKELQKNKKGIRQKLRSIFHKNELPLEIECTHTNTRLAFDVASESIITICCNPKCKKVIGRDDPQSKSRNYKEKSLIILEALQK